MYLRYEWWVSLCVSALYESIFSTEQFFMGQMQLYEVVRGLPQGCEQYGFGEMIMHSSTLRKLKKVWIWQKIFAAMSAKLHHGTRLEAFEFHPANLKAMPRRAIRGPNVSTFP